MSELGAGPQKVYRRMRLLAARRLVEQTGLTIVEIAIRCGYRDPSAMTRAFGAEFGVSPREVRAMGSKSLIGTIKANTFAGAIRRSPTFFRLIKMMLFMWDLEGGLTWHSLFCCIARPRMCVMARLTIIANGLSMGKIDKVMEINGLASDRAWDWENGYFWFSHPSRINKFLAH